MNLIITWDPINIRMVAIILRGRPFHLARRCTSQQQITLMKDCKNFNDTLRDLMNKISKMDISFVYGDCNAKIETGLLCIQDKMHTVSQIDRQTLLVKVFF